MSDENGKPEWDVFLSYASEDRSDLAEPLAQVLEALGLKVWFDRVELQLGDSLRRRIDEGLARCLYGVAILSPAFFSKHYPQRELDGLAQREVEERKVILPIWHNVTDSQVRFFSPPLADRVAAKSEEGVMSVALKILRVVRPGLLEAAEEFARSLPILTELRSGRELALVLGDALGFNLGNDEPRTEAEMELIADFHEYIQDWLDFASDADAGERVRAEFELAGKVQRLRQAGWFVFGKREMQKFRLGDKPDKIPVALVVLAREGATQVIQVGDNFIISRPPEGSGGAV